MSRMPVEAPGLAPGEVDDNGRMRTASLVTYLPGSTPLVLDSPHSGTDYPADFRHACDLTLLRTAEDTHVEKLYDFAPSLGAAWVEAHFPRSYLDANRDRLEIDTELLDGPWPDPVATDPAQLSKVRLGKGLIWRCTDDGVPLYDHRLSVAEVKSRIERCWVPYHAAVADAIEAAHARHGYSLHINCHSMPSVAGSHATGFAGERHPDMVLGNRDQTTSSPELLEWMAQHLTALGYEVQCNHPYKGVELVRRHSHPAAQRHSVQLEVNRRLYMNEATFEKTEGFVKLQNDLRQLVESMLTLDPRRLAL